MYKPVATMSAQDNSGTVLTKNLSQRVIDGSFNELIEYFSTTEGDDLNPPYETDAERRLAHKFHRWKNEMSRGFGNAAYNLRFIDGEGKLSEPLSPEARVRDHLGRILKPARKETERGPVEYQEAELVFQYFPVGGSYLLE